MSFAETGVSGRNDGKTGVPHRADLFQQYVKVGLVDEFQIHLVPLLLGDGVRLFEELGAQAVELEPTGTVESPSGVTHLSYRVVKSLTRPPPGRPGPRARPASGWWRM